jgi:hypothetical protein
MSIDDAKKSPARPWYREPWPWILAAGPAIVVVAGIYTAWLAVSTNDGLVTEDYYRKGLAAHQTVTRSEQATRLGLVAGVRIVGEVVSVSLRAGEAAFVPPAAITLTISHPTRAGLDQTRNLQLKADSYVGNVRLPAAGHWLILVEDEARSWRLMGNVVLPASGEVLIGGSGGTPVAADIRNR